MSDEKAIPDPLWLIDLHVVEIAVAECHSSSSVRPYKINTFFRFTHQLGFCHVADSHFLLKFWKINPEEARDSVPTLLEVEKNIISGHCLPYGLPFCEQNLSVLLLINQEEEFFFSSHFCAQLHYAARFTMSDPPRRGGTSSTEL